jgi:PD-(D/E)XK endonuclease
MGFLDMKSKAEKSEAAILARLSGQEGVTILLPFGGGNGRYDMVIDDHGTFYRVQCKTGRLEQNGTVVAFNAASSTYHYYGGKARERRDYRGQVEYFGVYCPQINRAFLVPVDIVGKTEGKLRLVETKNNQSKNVHWAEDYAI